MDNKQRAGVITIIFHFRYPTLLDTVTTLLINGGGHEARQIVILIIDVPIKKHVRAFARLHV